jgi:hypothetical protein
VGGVRQGALGRGVGMSLDEKGDKSEIEIIMQDMKYVLISILTFFAWTAQAQNYDTKELFSKGAWSVELTHNTTEGTLWCDATTRNRAGQEFSITAFDSGTMALFVFDNRWSLTKRSVKFLLDIDYARWTIDGTANDKAVSAVMSDARKSVEFLTGLQRGSAVAVFNESERRLATFSLSGSSAALTMLMDCWKRIDVKDPFGNGSDPFGASADPFG